MLSIPTLGGFDVIANNFELILTDFNKMLVWMGLSISFPTLQDTTKTQNEFSRKVWEDPRKGKRMLILLIVSIILILTFGIFGYFFADNSMIQEVSFGSIVLGIGLMGMLKAAAEMFENHRLDKAG